MLLHWFWLQFMIYQVNDCQLSIAKCFIWLFCCVEKNTSVPKRNSSSFFGLEDGHIPAKWPKSKKIKVLYFLELLTVNDIIWTFLHNMAIFFLLTNRPILRFDNGTVTQTFWLLRLGVRYWAWCWVKFSKTHNSFKMVQI